MVKWLLVPPVTFIIILIFSWILSCLFSKLSFKPKEHTHGEGEPYACGEEDYDHTAQPDYTVFFPFAFFFTLAHVATLMMSTVPIVTIQSFCMAGIYIIGAGLGLYILFRK